MKSTVELDQETINAARSQEPQAMDRIYRATYSTIFNFIYRKIQDNEVASDLTQDTFFKAFTAISKTNENLNLQAWLFTIARNVCTDFWRTNKLQTMNDPFDEENFKALHLNFNNPMNDPFSALQNKEFNKLLYHLLQNLNPQQRHALILKDVEGLSYANAAQVMNMSQSAFTSLLNRARIKLTKLIVGTLSTNVNVSLGYKECSLLLNWFDPLDWPNDLHQEITYKTQKYFDGMAKGYCSFRAMFYPTVLDDILLTHCHKKENAIGADFGSGVGQFALKMAGRFSQVHAIDISPQMVAIAQQNCKNEGIRNINVSLGDLQSINLPDESLDVVYCVVVLHHVLDPSKSIKEMFRVLKKGGQLILADFGQHKLDILQYQHNDLWLGFQKAQMVKWLKKSNFQSVWLKDYPHIGFSLVERYGDRVHVPLLLAGGTK